MLNKKKVALVSIIGILVISLIGALIYFSFNKNSSITVGANKDVKATEEVINEIKEDVILVSLDETIDESLKEKKEEIVEYKGKEIKVPKSKVASANSAEDGERNKKKGGANVSQEQANNMFENVGVKSKGIDVSSHQGNINWKAVRDSGVEFAMIRCGFRGQTQGGIYEDRYFKQNVAGATANGIKVGIYFYSTAINETEALEEAIWTVRKISTYRITYPVVYDFEDFNAYRCGNVDGAQATKNALTFLNFVRDNGYEPMMYANKNDITTRLSRGSFGCKFWLAHYTKETDYKGNINMWQYTSSGSVPGINGRVDMNIAYFNYGTTAAPKHTHDFSEPVRNGLKEPTCTTPGSKTTRCKCGETQTEEIPALGHKWGEWVVTKEATEKEEGLKIRKCTREGCTETETKSIPKKQKQPGNEVIGPVTPDTPKCEHKHTHQVVKKEATCTENGERHIICDECKQVVRKEKIDKLGHKFVDGKETCTNPGCKVKNPNWKDPNAGSGGNGENGEKPTPKPTPKPDDKEPEGETNKEPDVNVNPPAKDIDKK